MDRLRQQALEEVVFVSLLRAADLLSQNVAELLKPHGLSPAQYNVLRILRGAGEAGLPCGEIGARLIARDPDVTRLVDRMERRGLVSRARSRDDRRVVRVGATAAGLELLATLDGPILELHRRDLGEMGRERLRALLDLLEQARSAADRGRGGPGLPAACD